MYVCIFGLVLTKFKLDDLLENVFIAGFHGLNHNREGFSRLVFV